MAEIILMKSLKSIIAFFCYFGTGVVALDEFSQGAVHKALQVSPAANAIVLYLLIIFWMIKIVWFIYEKFILESKERNLNMDRTREEIIIMRFPPREEKEEGP
jgi:hypothetical protein